MADQWWTNGDADNDWETAGNWASIEGGADDTGPPGAGDTVYFSDTSTGSSPGDNCAFSANAACKDLYTDNGDTGGTDDYTGTIDLNGFDLTVGDGTNDGVLDTSSACTLDLGEGDIIIEMLDTGLGFDFTNCTVHARTSTIKLVMSVNTIMESIISSRSGGNTLYDVEMHNDSSTYRFFWRPADMSLHDLTGFANGTRDNRLQGNELLISGDFTLAAGGGTGNTIISWHALTQVAGNCDLQGGGGAGFFAVDDVLRMTGDGTTLEASAQVVPDLEILANVSTTVGANGVYIFGVLTIDADKTWTVSKSRHDPNRNVNFNLNGTLVINDEFRIISSTGDLPTLVWGGSGAIDDDGSGTLVWQCEIDQSIPAGTYDCHVEVESAGSPGNPLTITLTGNVVLGAGKNWLFDCDDTVVFALDMDVNDLTVPGTWTQKGGVSGGTEKLTLGAGTLTVGGNFTADGSEAGDSTIDSSGGGEIVFSGAAAQAVLVGGNELHDVTVTNAHASGVTFGDVLHMNGVFKCVTAGALLTFKESVEHVFADLNLGVADPAARVKIRSATPATQTDWNVEQAYADLTFIDNLDVQDNDATPGFDVYCGADSTLANTTAWFASVPVTTTPYYYQQVLANRQGRF